MVAKFSSRQWFCSSQPDLGGSGADQGYGVAVAAADNAYVDRLCKCPFFQPPRRFTYSEFMASNAFV